MSISKNGQRINTLEEWKSKAPPKSLYQWVVDRSAMEVARTWLAVESPSFPPEVAAVIAYSPAFGVVNSWNGEPEVKLPFDDLPGEPRNSDLVIHAHDQYGTFVIAIEAKADEPFSNTVADALAGALDRSLKNPRSNGILRIEQLSQSILSARQPKTPAIGKLRYQLLTSTAGALSAAQNCCTKRVIFLVHEFITNRTLDRKKMRKMLKNGSADSSARIAVNPLDLSTALGQKRSNVVLLKEEYRLRSLSIIADAAVPRKTVMLLPSP